MQRANAEGRNGVVTVYRAIDTRLERTVAIKVLPEHLAESRERRERFSREAKIILRARTFLASSLAAGPRCSERTLW